MTIRSGVPLGVQTEVLDRITNGLPRDVTLAAPLDHCPLAQGGELPPVIAGKVQPATLYGAAIVAIGMPITLTLGLTTVG